MAIRASRLLCFAAVAALSLAACSQGAENNLASLDNQLTGNDVDPALASALEDQIAVDRNLAQQSNANAVRPPDAPAQAQYPAGSAGAPVTAPAGACGDDTKYDRNSAWANRLPPAFPLYPGGRVTEAAGTTQGCRVVTFMADGDYQRILDWYHTRATRAGYSSEHQVRGSDHILAGANERTGGAFYLVVTPGRAGAEVALIANQGA